MNRLLSNSDVLEDNIAPWDSRDARLQDLHVETVDASEEPQVGFRWDSPVSYQLSMRYGRRSKLELLWRLGAIPFSRGLHTKRLPWEKQDHLYITPHSYASAVNSSLPQQQTKHGITNGDFIKAGWVHRLFSGDTSQEFSTTRAAELRRLNRMRGIITYLETLDLRASSMHNGLAADAQERIWHWDVRDLVAVKHASDDRQTPHSITSRLYQASERLVTGLLPLLDDKGVANYASSVKQKLLKDCLHLATIGYVITDHSFVQAAVKIAISVLPDLSAANYTSVLQLGQPPVGYAFPSLPTKLLDSQQQVTLPYDPLFFDVAALVDVVRLVRLSGSERTLRPAERMWIKDLDMVLAKHLQILLLSKDGIEMSSTPPSFETAMTYDKSVLVLSAYFNIPSLVSRVQHRHHLRYLDPATGQITDEASTPLITKLYETFRKGLNNVALDIKAEMDRDSSVHSIIEDLLRLSRAQ